MRMVSSPTARAFFIALAALLCVPMLAAGSASAATPQAPGSFKGYGFDACVAPSQAVMDQWNLKSPYSAIGIYISGNSRYCGDKYQPNLSAAWVQNNTDKGWRFMPIHVGYQAPCFTNNPNSRVQKKKMSYTVSTARAQARSDAAESLAAASKYGFGTGTALYLDIEWYPRTNKTCDNVVLHFIDAWTEIMRAAGYLSGVYSSGSAAIASLNAARLAGRPGMTYPEHLWIAWTNQVANVDGGPYLSDALWNKHQRIHQYHNNVTQTFGYKLTIDKNFLDVGQGLVAKTEPKPCGVRMSFPSYSYLAKGSTGAQVAALNCQLTRLGYLNSTSTTYGSATVTAVNKFRQKIGWSQAGTVTSGIWTALMAAGNKPRIMKYGTNFTAVWELQRTLVAAGYKIDITGKYSQPTVNAVVAFRKKHGLPAYTTVESTVWFKLRQGKVG